MQDYIDFFREEAKRLLKSLKNNDKDAKKRCFTVFGDREDLSLMNIQHVIAKEYGFESWNDLIKQDPFKLAEVLVFAKNKTINTPFKKFGSNNVSSAERSGYSVLKQPSLIYDENEKTLVQKLNPQSPTPFISKYIHITQADVSEYDLSKLNPINTSYSNLTVWPNKASKMPKGFNPKEFLEQRKNPGLGIKTLHKLGIKGQNRAVAIIDCWNLSDHLEYHSSLKGYEEIGENFLNGSTATELVSSIVGRTCGIAPFADAYYYAVDTLRSKESPRGSQINFAKAIKKVCELHKKLKQDGKNGIDIIHIQPALTSKSFQTDDGYDETLNAVKEAEILGIWCNISNSFREIKYFREERVYCKFGGNLDNPNDYELTEYSVLHKIPHADREKFEMSLCFPGGARTVASELKMNAYNVQYCAGSLSGAYATGLYLLAKSVKENITPLEFFEQGLKTGTFKEGVGTIINPVALIESLR